MYTNRKTVSTEEQKQNTASFPAFQGFNPLTIPTLRALSVPLRALRATSNPPASTPRADYLIIIRYVSLNVNNILSASRLTYSNLQIFSAHVRKIDYHITPPLSTPSMLFAWICQDREYPEPHLRTETPLE